MRLQEQKIIEYFQNSGYPFAAVSLKNIEIKDDKINAELQVTKGPLYHIDSIRVYGKVKIKKLFLQHYHTEISYTLVLHCSLFHS